MARSRGGQFDTIFDDFLKGVFQDASGGHFFEILIDFRSKWGAHWGPIGGAKWCNEPPNLEKGASLVPKGVPRAPQSPPGPLEASPEVDFGVILERFWRYFGSIWGGFSLHFSMLENHFPRSKP